ncbi:MAG: BadF/BadG/BcrA/BcrD ATPase family protein [Lachnospiraceae bacterium]
MRMQKAVNRENYLEGFKDELDGIIYHTVKFCDNFGYEYAWLKERIGVPLLLVETDATKQCEGQIRTRVEAFLESLDTEGKKVTGRKKSMEDGHMYVLGIDSGSTSTNAVIINEKEEILASHVIRTGAKSGESAEQIFQEVLEKAGLAKENLDLVVSTGYGRVSIDFADENITEITCHGRGAHYFNPSVHTILDIGGQDSKAIHLSDSGR